MTHPSALPGIQRVSIDAYQRSIDTLASSKSEFVFDSEGSENAAIIISSIFKYSKNIVRIYATNMNGDISDFNIYTSSLVRFLYEKKNLLVLLDNPDYITSNDAFRVNKEFRQVINRFYSQGNIVFKVASEGFKKGMKSIATDSSSLYHFAVGDNHMIRIELDNKKRISVCSFNNQKMAQPLIRIFDTYFPDCESINISTR